MENTEIMHDNPYALKRAPRREWTKMTWSKKVRAMKLGDELPIGSSKYETRQSRYLGARKAFPEARFSMGRNMDEVYVIKRIA